MKAAIIVCCLILSIRANPSSNNSRIVNGDVAVEGQFPYQVSIRYDGVHGCGGSILDATTILCAAHCVESLDPGAIQVTLGNTALSAQTEIHQVESYKYHPDFKRNPNVYDILSDISILKLRTPIVYREGVRPVKLRQTDISEETVVFSGWGTLSLGGQMPDKLHFVDLKTLTTSQCQKRVDGKIADIVLCAIGKPDQGVCHGDSGGPLVDKNRELIGIASWGIPCGIQCDECKPVDIYTRVYNFLDWIEENRH